jgi:hypothetical protein
MSDSTTPRHSRKPDRPKKPAPTPCQLGMFLARAGTAKWQLPGQQPGGASIQGPQGFGRGERDVEQLRERGQPRERVGRSIQDAWDHLQSPFEAARGPEVPQQLRVSA